MIEGLNIDDSVSTEAKKKKKKELIDGNLSYTTKSELIFPVTKWVSLYDLTKANRLPLQKIMSLQ